MRDESGWKSVEGVSGIKGARRISCRNARVPKQTEAAGGDGASDKGGGAACVRGRGTAEVSKEQINKGEEVTFTAKADKGNKFVGWYDIFGNEVSKEASYKVTPEDNLTLVAKFEESDTPVDPDGVNKDSLK